MVHAIKAMAESEDVFVSKNRAENLYIIMGNDELMDVIQGLIKPTSKEQSILILKKLVKFPKLSFNKAINPNNMYLIHTTLIEYDYKFMELLEFLNHTLHLVEESEKKKIMPLFLSKNGIMGIIEIYFRGFPQELGTGFNKMLDQDLIKQWKSFGEYIKLIEAQSRELYKDSHKNNENVRSWSLDGAPYSAFTDYAKAAGIPGDSGYVSNATRYNKPFNNSIYKRAT